MSSSPNANVTQLSELQRSAKKGAPYGLTIVGGKLLVTANDDGKIFTRTYGQDDDWTQLGFGESLKPVKGLAPGLCLWGSEAFLAFRKDEPSKDETPIGVALRNGPTSWAFQAATPNNASTEASTENPLTVVTDHPPAVVGFDNTVYMAYKRDSNHLLGIAKSGAELSDNWTAFKIRTTAALKAVTKGNIRAGDSWVITNRAPALTDATIDDEQCLFLVFGVNGTSDLWYGYRAHPASGDDWTLAAIPNVECQGTSPGIVNCGTQVAMVYIASNDDDHVYTTVFDLASKTWSTPALFKGHENNRIKADDQLALTFDGSFFYLSWVRHDTMRVYKIKKDQILPS